MLIAGVQDCSRVVAVYIVNDGLLTHKLESLDSKQVCRLKKLHHIVQSDLALICIEIGQNFNKDLVAYFFKRYAGSCLICLFMSGGLLEHGCEVGASREEKFVRGHLTFIGSCHYKGKVRIFRVADPTLEICCQRRFR